VKNLCTARGGTGVTVYRAYGNGNTGTVTANLGSTPTNAIINVTSYSNVNTTNPIGNVVAANSNGVNGSCSGGTDTTSYTLPISAGGNTVVYGTGSIRLRDHTPGSGFTEREETHQGSGGDMAGLFVQDSQRSTSGTVNMSGTLSSATNWAVAAIEVVGATGGTGGGSGLPGDANGDGRVDGIDYVVWLNNYSEGTSQGPAEGDFNSDNLVDGRDYVVWLNNYGSSTSQGAAFGDFNGDDIVDGRDYVVWLNNYGTSQ
jgi:hypothetical protein